MTVTTKTWDEMRGGYIDSRDIIARTDELESAAAEEPDEFGCCACGEGSRPDEGIPSLCPECADELRILRDFSEQGEGYYGDWAYGETFVPEDEFEDYARQLAEDLGMMPDQNSWPASYIDWAAAARALREDYSAVEVDGITYLGRA